MSSAPDQESDKIVSGFHYGQSLYVTIDQVETKWGTFYKCALLSGTRILTEAYARHPDRAQAFALRDYSDWLIRESRRD